MSNRWLGPDGCWTTVFLANGLMFSKISPGNMISWYHLDSSSTSATAVHGDSEVSPRAGCISQRGQLCPASSSEETPLCTVPHVPCGGHGRVPGPPPCLQGVAVAHPVSYPPLRARDICALLLIRSQTEASKKRCSSRLPGKGRLL